MQQTVKDSLVGKKISLVYPDKKVVSGTICGRWDKFATVTWSEHGTNVGLEVAWETVVNYLNSGKPVRI